MTTGEISAISDRHGATRCFKRHESGTTTGIAGPSGARLTRTTGTVDRNSNDFLPDGEFSKAWQRLTEIDEKIKTITAED